MSFSSKNIRKDIILEKTDKEEVHKAFTKKYKKLASLKNDNHQKEIFKKLNECTVLNFIRNTNRKETVKTNYSESSKELDYDLCMINKFDENLNSSLSFISEFDLEDDEKDNNNSFNSLGNESVEEIEINKKPPKDLYDKEDEENHTKLEKEWEDIQEMLFGKNAL
jgi:hypothetical protein